MRPAGGTRKDRGETNNLGWIRMAELGEMNIKAHVSTYDKVIGMLKWGAVGCAIIAALVVWLIA